MSQISIAKSDIISKSYFYYIVVYSSLISFFVSDSINKYLYVYFELNGISDLVRAGFEVLFFILLFLHFTKTSAYVIFGVGVLLTTFSIGQFYFFQDFGEFSKFIGNFKIFNKYIFIFILYQPVKYIAQAFPAGFHRIVNLFYYLILLNSILIIVGFVFDISLFESYPFKSYRFGYSGLIPKINEATLFSFIGICFVYFRRFKLKIMLKKDYIVFLAPLFLGAKGIYFFIILLLIFHVISKKNIILNSIVLFISFLIPFVYFLNFPEKIHYFSQQARTYGFFSMLLSGRDDILENYSIEIIEKWGIINYLVGGQDQTYRMFEMDFVDIFFFFGIFGAIGYFSLIFITVFNFKSYTALNLFVIFTYFILAFLGGHFFGSAINALYLAIFTVYLNYFPGAER